MNIVKGTFGWGVIGLVGYNMLTYCLIGSWANAMLAKHSKISSGINEDALHMATMPWPQLRAKKM